MTTPGTDDLRWMAAAAALGRRGLGRVWPNPAVGCVLVRDGVVVGRGRTADGGRPHAEAVALAQAGDAARGATAYVTLEPCAHTGRGGPCADAMVAARVGRVVVALADPDPRTAGQGIARLRAAGIDVTAGVGAPEVAADLGGWLQRWRDGRPRVTLKLAQSIDGRIATAIGESRWITGRASRARVHAERARHDAVLVGAGTARADDPRLTVRGMGPRPQPVRIVLTADLDLPLDGRLAGSVAEAPLWLVHGAAPDLRRQAWAAVGARLIEVQGGPRDLHAVLRSLGGEGLTSVYVEGGGQVAASLIAAGLVDRMVDYRAGLALGDEAVPGVGVLPRGPLAAAARWRAAAIDQSGADTRTVWETVGFERGLSQI